jgi:hypothetical protein
MYTLRVPNRQYRRATQVLGPKLSTPIDYDMVKQDDGFYLFSFPDVDEYDFRDIVMLLKANGVTTIGADDILTERKIMKLTDLLKEQANPDENNIIDQLEVALKRWEEDKSPPYDRLDACERSDQYQEDIKDIIDSFKNPLPSPGEEDRIEKDDEDLANAKMDLDTMQEAKGYRGDSPMPFRDNPDANDEWSKKQIAKDSATIKKVINLKMDSEIGEPVTVEYKPGTNLTDVTISWGNESHTVDFEAGVDDHGEGWIETMADSDDGRWQFILDVQVEASFPMTGDFADWDFDELIVQGHPDNEDHLDPEDRSDYENEDFELEPEDMDNPDEDLVIIGSGYLDIKNKFKGRPNMTNGELAALGQKVVDQLHKGDKDAAFDYIMSKINEGSCGYSQEALTKRQLQIRAGIIK